MNPANRKQIARAIRSVVPGLHEKARVLVATPRKRILRGFYIEDSSDPNRAYVWAFVQPLYVPATTIVLSLGERLGGPSRAWGVEEIAGIASAARDNGTKFFGPIDSADALCTWEILDHRGDEYAREARAYSLLLSGRADEATKRLRELVGMLSGGAPWMREMKERDEALAALAESNPKAATELLAKWEKETAAALRVVEIP